MGCYDDAQCAPNAADSGAPSCVPFDAGVPTGGGLCGCASIASCNDGQTCTAVPNTFGPPICTSACTFTSNGDDSCLYQNFTSDLPSLCNTETGACQQCFVDADCTGLNGFSDFGFTYPEPFCTDGGACVACFVPNDCPLNTPGCVAGACGQCVTSANCPSGDAGLWVCQGGACFVGCTPDGGQCAATPFTPVCGAGGICVQCRTVADCDVDAGFRFCVQGTCEF